MYDFAEVMDTLRLLAKDNYWQTLYSQSKEVYGIRLFENSTDYTFLQIAFLNELGFYSSLTFAVAMNEVSELVLKEPMYAEAYSFYRNKNRKTKKVSSTAEKSNLPRDVAKEEIVNKNQWVFTKTKGKPR